MCWLFFSLSQCLSCLMCAHEPRSRPLFIRDQHCCHDLTSMLGLFKSWYQGRVWKPVSCMVKAVKWNTAILSLVVTDLYVTCRPFSIHNYPYTSVKLCKISFLVVVTSRSFVLWRTKTKHFAKLSNHLLGSTESKTYNSVVSPVAP